MKKLLTALTACLLILCGCTSPNKANDYTGPVVTEDTMTDEEKELHMIQSCISAYNNQQIAELEDALQISITSLPIGIDTLPEITSLNDLTEVKDAESTTNTAYVGQYSINDSYYALFFIYKPTSGTFWLNGRITFNIDPASVPDNDPKFADYKSALDPMLSVDNMILNWLYGINVTLGSEEIEPGYFPVTGMGSYTPASIDDIKAIAESVFTADFLTSNYYPAAFESASPVFKEIDGKLCCIETELMDRTYPVYNTSKIINAVEDDNSVFLDILTIINQQDQPEIKRIVMVKTDQGYRLPQNY
ncbi:MAG: hypothetical protein EOM64_00105 [Erysipelotrichia bacterium]|nr:hypothetical protein [Erysipelotrichia bacterium]